MPVMTRIGLVLVVAGWMFGGCNCGGDTNMGNYSSQPSPKGKEFRHTFAAAGTFKYHCAIHPETRGIERRQRNRGVALGQERLDLRFRDHRR